MPEHQDGGARMAGKHRRSDPRCNHCHKVEGELQGGADRQETVRLLTDLEIYDDEERVFQAPRQPGNPLPEFLVWCVGCARDMADHGDPIENFQEFGYESNSPEGPYARYLQRVGRGLRWPRS